MISPLSESFWSELFSEDAPFGDKTSDSLKVPDFTRTAKIIAKEDMSLSGADDIFASIPKNLELNITTFYKDGARVYEGQCIALLEGHWKSLLLVERPILNWIGHLSGIASHAWRFSEEVKNTKCKILDTRKTTPLYREVEKKAVRDGKAFNHRTNLSTGMMLKENHLSLYDFSFSKAVLDCMESNPDLHLTVETSNLAQVELVLKTKAHRVMLDNFDNQQIAEALELIKSKDSKIEVEASGNMTLERVKSVAELGVDFISVGAITHSAPHADISQLMDF
jgi:nicotinate-nucleotide pyrophosphorylase (carboxylating)